MVLQMSNKTKLTLSIKKDILERAKEVSNKMGVSISKLVENFLAFYASPTLHCFHCGKKFDIRESKVCLKCGWYICPHCGGCGCSLDDSAKKVAFEMKKVYDELLLTDIRFRGEVE